MEDILNFVQPPPVIQTLQSAGVRSYIATPLVAQGELVGTLNLVSDKPGAFAPEHIDIVREVADPLAIAIQQAHLREQTQHHAAELEHRVAERTAELQQINAELDTFAYSVSHDLRAPLRAISSFAQIIARRHRADLNEEGKHYFDNIVEASAQMSHLIDDLLRYSRIGRPGVGRIGGGRGEYVLC